MTKTKLESRLWKLVESEIDFSIRTLAEILEEGQTNESIEGKRRFQASVVKEAARITRMWTALKIYGNEAEEAADE